jgi:hypothetical protein
VHAILYQIPYLPSMAFIVHHPLLPALPRLTTRSSPLTHLLTGYPFMIPTPVVISHFPLDSETMALLQGAGDDEVQVAEGSNSTAVITNIATSTQQQQGEEAAGVVAGASPSPSTTGVTSPLSSHVKGSEGGGDELTTGPPPPDLCAPLCTAVLQAAWALEQTSAKVGTYNLLCTDECMPHDVGTQASYCQLVFATLTHPQCLSFLLVPNCRMSQWVPT